MTNNGSGNIRILPPEEVRRIAAGEVIDRPAAIVREFIDNAIDAGSSSIEVLIEGGGSKKTEVVDDGAGMDRENIEKCWFAHATSKINSLDDLNSCETLGFRGEALSTIATVAGLVIISSAGGGATTNDEAWRLEVGPGENNPPRITGTSRTRGSTVRALNLFDTLPARKRFLKRDGSEAALCRQVFMEKALAFPQITFRYIQDGRLKDFLPAINSKKERFASALLDIKSGGRDFLHEIHTSGEGFTAEVVIGGPELYRSDRRMLYVFANGRRIQDYSLMQAMEYGTQGWFPNGTHPIGAVYVDIDPDLADFNIHPAKREARFKNSGAIHQALSGSLRNFCRQYSVKSQAQSGNEFYIEADTKRMSYAQHSTPIRPLNQSLIGHRQASLYSETSSGSKAAMDALLNNAVNFSPNYVAEEVQVYCEPRYAGRIFGFFILAEWGDKLYIIDQHAAHERILYNRFLSQLIPVQELLVPITFGTESIEEDLFLEAKQEELAKLAILIQKDGNGWQINALPAGWQLGDAETVREIIELRRAGENIAERWAATLCCHKAIRDGDQLSDVIALDLIKEVFNLPDPRCPHGRPIWTEISREALKKAVRRLCFISFFMIELFSLIT